MEEEMKEEKGPILEKRGPILNNIIAATATTTTTTHTHTLAERGSKLFRFGEEYNP
jgi:hypothetical protein